jgi:hypothetical protein
MTNMARAPRARKGSRRPDATVPAQSPEALALDAKLGGGALPLTSLSPADRTGLDNLSRRGAIRLLLGLSGEVVVARAGR